MDDKLREWLIKHYKHTENKKISERFGLSMYHIHKYARDLGLKKSRQFMAKVAKQNSEKGCAVLKEKGYPPKGYIIPNADLGRKRFIAKIRGKKQKKDHLRKRMQTIKELRASEKRRVLFGLEQRTKYRVVKAPKYKLYMRCKMRKLGYIIERGSNEAYITKDTIRSTYYENKAKDYGIDIILDNLNT